MKELKDKTWDDCNTVEEINELGDYLVAQIEKEHRKIRRNTWMGLALWSVFTFGVVCWLTGA